MMRDEWDICQSCRYRHTLVKIIDCGIERIRLRAYGRKICYDG